MSEPQITVALVDTEFTLGELQDFIQTARSIDGIPQNALVAVEHEIGAGATLYTLTASTAYRSKGDA